MEIEEKNKEISKLRESDVSKQRSEEDLKLEKNKMFKNLHQTLAKAKKVVVDLNLEM